MTNPSPQAGMIRRPGAASGAIVRANGFAKPAEPVELTIAKLNLVRSIMPSIILGASLIGGGYFLSRLLAASPNAQMVQAMREASSAQAAAAEQNAAAVKAASDASGCKALLCVNLGNQQPTAPTVPPVVIQQPDYQQPVQQAQVQPPVQSTSTQAMPSDPRTVGYWRAYRSNESYIQQSWAYCNDQGWQSIECIALSQALSESHTY